MTAFSRRCRNLEAQVVALGAEVAQLREAAAPPAVAAPDPEVARLRKELADLTAAHTALKDAVEASRRAAETPPASPMVPVRSEFELSTALERARTAAVDVDPSTVTAMLRVLARDTRDHSIYELCGNMGTHFVDAVRMVAVLRDAGVIEVSRQARMDDRVTLTAAGRDLARTLLDTPVAMPAPLPAPDPAPAAAPTPPSDGAAAAGATAVETPPAAAPAAPFTPAAALALSMGSAAAIDVARARGTGVRPDAYATILVAVRVYSDQPMTSLAKRHGLSMIEAAQAAAVLRDAGLIHLVGAGNSTRVRPTEDGRRLAKALEKRAAAGPALG